MNLHQLTSFLTTQRSSTPEVISFKTTRRAVGILGITLPWALWAGTFIFRGHDLQPSISHFYYTNMREVFVGVLCAVALFLFTYKGHSKVDSYAANAAGMFALGVAVFPTDIIVGHRGQAPVVSVLDLSFHNIIHFTCAGLFFVTLALMSLLLFTKSNKPKAQWDAPKKNRNRTYIICGWIMLASIVLIAISEPILKVSHTSTITYWMETVALSAFGISWLTKGEVLFGD